MKRNPSLPCVLLVLLLSGWDGSAVAQVRGRAMVTSSPPTLSPLRVRASGRYFETGQGRPWFWLGDTAWSLLTNYTPAEQKIYLAARAKKGFTIIQTVAAWDGGTGTEKKPNPNPNTAGVQPWRDGDPLKPNEAYWKGVDSVIAEAAKDGIYIGLLPSWGSFVVNTKMINLSNAEAYGRWLGHRYRNAPNLVWIEGGDRDVIWYGKGSKKYAPYIAVWRALARGLREGDGGTHLILFHPGGTLRDNQQETWLAADMIQTWAWYKTIPHDVSIDYHLKPTKPVILAEGAYENGPEYPTHPITPLVVRKQAYWAYLSGGFFTYGYGDLWFHPPDWKAALDSQGARNMQVLRAVFGSISWWNLRPDQKLFASGEGSGRTYNAAAVSSDGGWAMAYLSHPGTVELNLGELKGQPDHIVQATRFAVTWIDPRNGQRREEKPCEASGERSFTSPAGWPDAVLLFERSGK